MERVDTRGFVFDVMGKASVFYTVKYNVKANVFINAFYQFEKFFFYF